MKVAVCALILVGLVAFEGCGGTGTPGGPGTKTETGGPHKTSLGGPAEDTFTINVPTLATTLKQGESKTIALSLKRGTNFDEDVTVKFEDVPEGLTIEPTNPKIAKSEKDTQVTIKAAKDAALGKFTIKVVGEPTRGKPASNSLNVTVDKAS
jgi:uncharacterized membrane protein